jgi:hypothetical protein
MDDSEKERNFKPTFRYTKPKNGGTSLILSQEGVFRHENGEYQTLADAVDFFWSAVAYDPASWTDTMIGYRYLLENSFKADHEDLRRALNWLETAISVRARLAIVAAARYIAAMPLPLLASNAPRLFNILGSRTLGMVWRITPDFDPTPLPPRVPKFGDEAGYGLIRSVPELYLKAMELSPDLENLVIAMTQEAMRYNVSVPPELEQKAKV